MQTQTPKQGHKISDIYDSSLELEITSHYQHWTLSQLRMKRTAMHHIFSHSNEEKTLQLTWAGTSKMHVVVSISRFFSLQAPNAGPHSTCTFVPTRNTFEPNMQHDHWTMTLATCHDKMFFYRPSTRLTKRKIKWTQMEEKKTVTQRLLWHHFRSRARVWPMGWRYPLMETMH